MPGRPIGVLFAAAIAAMLLTAGCSDETLRLLNNAIDRGYQDAAASAGPSRRLARQTVDERLVAGNTRFAFEIFSRLAKPDENTFICPASLSLALTMTYNGAAGETAAQMQDVLGYSGMELAVVNAASQVLLSNLIYGDELVRLEVANSLWPRLGLRFSEAFLGRNRRFFGAEITPLDMQDPTSVDVINGWVGDKTHGKIPQVLDAVAADAVLYLVNAIYFKGTWTYQFDPADTRDGVFTRGDGAAATVPMMKLASGYDGGDDKRLDYLANDDFQAVSLPYGEDRRFRMYVFLPAPGSSLSHFNALLTGDHWKKWLGDFAPAEGTVYLPRFSLEWDAELQETLARMGMPQAFGGMADFSAMFPPEEPRRVFISRVIHKTMLEVNEEGAEAAGATVVELRETSVSDGPFSLRVDRPFFLAIVDNRTGTILFMGNVTDPS